MNDKLVILDLDETLIHATKHEQNWPCDFKYEEYFIYKRPHVDQFLNDIAKHFTIGIWSSADDDYVDDIVRVITPPVVAFSFVWGRSRCSIRRDIESDTYCFEKRLDKLKKRGFRLEDMLIVDDSPEKSRTNYGNAIHIAEFNGDPSDEELPILLTYLMQLKDVPNVRSIEKRGWRNRTSGTLADPVTSV
ncbi:NIF family HAD-type phosphatase [Fibrella aquatilis]|uniref:HAD family hydrolase n=1 Tax=Fibrella aquatilis TaxID=2817059 RepID=A0A939K158_9BACT|nr:HAD family hydrolase [Fibrella aquatilis]MBO0933173.1 HAD family hydrolase [Fibrella aquatilis]